MEELRDQMQDMIQYQFRNMLHDIVKMPESVYFEDSSFDDLMTPDGKLRYELKMELISR